MAWLIFPMAIFPFGTSTIVSRPAAAPYAAAEALVLPVEAHSNLGLPRSSDLATATTIPLSLKDPVGLHPSSLKYKDSRPRWAPIDRDLTKGVSPSPILKEGA